MKNRVANEKLWKLGLVYHQSLPLTEIGDILEECGFDRSVLHGIYCGRSGRDCTKLDDRNYLYFTWYKMEQSGRFEIVAYIS